MLDDILKKEIKSVNKKAKAEIGGLKYIASLIQSENNFFKEKLRGYSNEEIYQEIKGILNQMHETYVFEERVLMDNVRGRSKEDIEKSKFLGFEKVTGKPAYLDGYFDTGEIISLTSSGKEILNNYRTSRGELSIKEYQKDLRNKIIARSSHLS